MKLKNQIKSSKFRADKFIIVDTRIFNKEDYPLPVRSSTVKIIH